MEATPGSGGRNNEVFIHLSNMCAAQREREPGFYIYRRTEKTLESQASWLSTELSCNVVL